MIGRKLAPHQRCISILLGCLSAAFNVDAASPENAAALTPAPILTNARKWAEPVPLFGSDPKLVSEIVAMEKAVEANFNNEFLHDPDAPLKYYSDHKDVSFIDILSPGEYHGENVRHWFNFIGPQFVGHLGLKNMHVYAKGTTGFVYMNQTYEGKLGDGRTFFWVMRQTDVVEKIKGEWKILHTHLSFAANPRTRDPFTWEVDLEMPPRPLPWAVGKK